jgi:2-amino-4-hydroxy-6-hydroxymethyldihydropteridine diphosphokinase
VLSIGSNVGDRLATLRGATNALAPWLVAASPVYETPPWGPVPQGNFYNAVLVVDDEAASPADWLARAQAAERSAGRTRDVRWGPRTLDVDVVDVDGIRSDDPHLTLPHPRAGERAFVLVPWLAVDAAAQLAGRPVADWLAELPAADVDAVQPIADGGLA